ncbi:MAG: sensor histidine kinase [Oceanidesulfovibrio sp.]
MDWLVFYEGTFPDLLILDVPPHEMYIRGVIMAIFLAFGLYAHRQIAANEQLNAQLRQTLADKEALLKEVHHRIKNNLGVILSLVEMQRESVTDPKALETLNQVRMRLDAITLIHRQIYSQETFAVIRLDTYLDNLSRSLSSLYNHGSSHIEFVRNLAPVEVTPQCAVPCGLIASELLANVFKHAHPDGSPGVMQFRLTALEKGFELSVCDDGVGFPEGFSLDQSNRLGLQLVKGLARQLDGSLDLQNSGGACVTLRVRNP